MPQKRPATITTDSAPSRPSARLLERSQRRCESVSGAWLPTLLRPEGRAPIAALRLNLTISPCSDCGCPTGFATVGP